MIFLGDVLLKHFNLQLDLLKNLSYSSEITSLVKSENTRTIIHMTGLSRRSHVLDLTEVSNNGKAESCANQQIRSPFSVLARNATGINSLEEHNQTSNVKESGGEGMFLKKDDPKVTALMQQAELLSSLAQKVNADNTEQRVENAWKVNQETTTCQHIEIAESFKLPDNKALAVCICPSPS